jgi:hypothetical protein
MGGAQTIGPEPALPDAEPVLVGGRLILDDQIRLLEIQPAKPEEPIQAKILVAQLSKSPKYEALSYTWGSTAEQQHIGITDNLADRDKTLPIPVTANCYAALKRLRHGITEPRKVWVDSICINQNDINERNHQMRLMTRIYKSAACVVVHLGESADRSDEAMDWIQEVDIPSDDTTDPSDRFSESAAWNDPTAHPDKAVMQALFNRPWFTRVWVLQEVHMASKAIVYCGNRTVDWGSFIVFKFWNTSMRVLEELPYIITAKPDKYSYLPPANALISALHDSRYCNATDPRDKLYAILPLMQQMKGKEGSADYAKAYEAIKVDYHLTPTQVFINLGKYIAEAIGPEIFKAVTGPSAMPGLPSWVPDWSMNARRRKIGGRWSIDYYDSGERYKVSEAQHASGERFYQLHLKGRYIGTITLVGSACDLLNDTLPLVEWQDLVPDLAALNKKYRSRYTSSHLAFDTLVGGSWDVLDIMKERIQAYHEGAEARLQLVQSLAAGWSPHISPPTDKVTNLVDFLESGFIASYLDRIRGVLRLCL